jgi:hypothetical protein
MEMTRSAALAAVARGSAAASKRGLAEFDLHQESVECVDRLDRCRRPIAQRDDGG